MAYTSTIEVYRGFKIDRSFIGSDPIYRIRKYGVPFAPAPGSVAAAKRIIDTYLKSVYK